PTSVSKCLRHYLHPSLRFYIVLTT
ncbi:hypothetical protein A2U01_0076608, partial [Trifolium medium]|nr:hypothetical protein [Trifolium medium]